MLRDLTRRLTLSLAALCALTFALAPEVASGQQTAGKKPNDGPLYPAKSGWKSGYIDRTGKLVIEAKYDHVGEFSEGLAVENQRCGIIDRTGKFVVQPVYNETREFSDGLALVRNAEWLGGYVNKSGEVVIAPELGSPGRADFNEGLAPAAFGTKFGFIDKLGHVVIQPQFDRIGPFSGGLAPVMYGGKMGYVDREGKFAIPASFAEAQPFSEGLAAASTCFGALGATGMDVSGNNCGYGYIDKTGKFVIEERFVSGEPFRGGLAQVYTRDGFGYIDREGNFVWKWTAP